ncbi:MAG TPA: LuxR C-terminal-related transcriptional regulator [Actinomycetota bacterium]
MARTDSIERGRAAFARRAWGDAHRELLAADRQAPLEPEDLELLAIASEMLARDEDRTEALTRAQNEYVRLGNLPRAARCAIWQGMSLLDRGEMAPAAGWLARAARMLEETDEECVERGLLLIPSALRLLFGEGDPAGAQALFEQAAAVAARFDDPDLTVLSGLGRGQSLIFLGERARGMALLDEAMVAATAASVTPIVVGIAYCSVIDACTGIFDVRRAREWTDVLHRWCESQPDLVSFRGQCLVHRVEILRLHGDWSEAESEAEQAGRLLSIRGPAGGPSYQLGELHRMRGDFASAEAAYRRASQLGRDPMPGLALLRLAQGQADVAATSIRRALDEAGDPATRCRLLPAFVEIMLEVGDMPAARQGADELAAMASQMDAALLRALSDQAVGAVSLAEGNARAALTSLRRAATGWLGLEAPYEGAQVRVLIGRACRALGDRDAAELELDAARATFEQLGATPDLARVSELLGTGAGAGGPGLTGREVEVLRLVAAGMTNRAIGAELFISEKTVARHVSNIFTKLALSSRSAATAYAYQHDLV